MRIDCRGAGGPPARGQKSGKQAEMPMFSITHGFRKGGALTVGRQVAVP